MKVVACYSVKGGVGKSTLAASLAWAAATISCRRTLLWDLDPQGDGGYLLGIDRRSGDEALSVFEHSTLDRPPVMSTDIAGLDVLPADPSLRRADGFLAKIGKKRRLAKLAASLAQRYDRIVLDCPPVMNELSSQILRAADVIVVPLTASPLAMRGLADVIEELRRHHGSHAPVLPVFAMFDARRKLHNEARAEHPDWPVVPMASVIERMGTKRQAIGAFAPRSQAAAAIGSLWSGIERKLLEIGDLQAN